MIDNGKARVFAVSDVVSSCRPRRHRLCGDTHRPAYLPERSDGAGGRVEYSGDRTPGECRQGYGQSLAACAGPTLSRRDELFLPQPAPARVSTGSVVDVHPQEGRPPDPAGE